MGRLSSGESGVQDYRSVRKEGVAGSIPPEAPTGEAPLLCSGGEGLCGGSEKEGRCSMMGGPEAGLHGL